MSSEWQQQNVQSHQCGVQVFPQQQQQQNAWGNPYTQQPPLDMETAASSDFSNDFRQQIHYSMVLQTYQGFSVPSTWPPRYISHLNVAAPPPARQDAHPSDIFASLDEAMATMPPNRWFPMNDPTLPDTYQDRQQWVQMLLNAVNNVPDIEGKKDNAFKKRWVVDRLTGYSYYSQLDKLTLCWAIEELVERMHRFGSSALNSFDDNLWGQAEKTRTWTFQHRMMRIVSLLAVSKNRCNGLLGGSGMQSMVANPDEKLVATKVQANQNGKRGKTLKQGQAIKRQRTAAHGS